MDQQTSSALLEQLVYLDNFVSNPTHDELTPNLDMDGQLSMDLAAFADDSFIFPDEDKKNDNNDDDNDNDNDNHNQKDENSLNNPDYDSIPLAPGPVPSSSSGSSKHDSPLNLLNANLENLPKFPVPPGAKNSLESVGLSKNQIDLLSALVAQHQSSLGNYVPQSKVPTLSTQSLLSPVRQHNFISGIENDSSSASSSTTVTPSFSSLPNLDKRRRNTAASARFRIKKKLKEKQMEDKISRLNELVKSFENKISNLEMENKLLKNLIIEKSSQKSDDELSLLKQRAKLN